MKKEYKGDYIILEPESRFDIIVLYWITKSIGKIGSTIKWREKIESGLKTKKISDVATILIQYNDIRIDHKIRSLRVTGRVIDTNKEELIGRKIGLDISINGRAIFPKDKVVEKVISKTSSKEVILVIVLDIDGYIIAEVSDRIEIIDEKYIPASVILDNEEEFRGDLEKINEIIRRHREKKSIAILGYNVGSKNLAKKIRGIDFKLEKTLNANMNGIITLLKEAAKNKELNINNEFIKSLNIYEELLSGKLTKVVYGIKDIMTYIDYKMVHTIIFSDIIIRDTKLLDDLYKIFLSCISLQFVDSHSSLGHYVNQLGGIIGITY